MDDETPMAASVSDDKKRDVNLDVKEAEIAGIGLGEEVSVTLTGKVKSVNAPYEYHTGKKGKLEKEPFGRMSLKISSIKISQASSNEFEQMAKEEEDE